LRRSIVATVGPGSARIVVDHISNSDRIDAMKLQGRNALVTGASKGIGRGAVLELAKLGANVAINYRSDDAGARALADEVRSLGVEALLLKADVADREAVESNVAETVDTFGSLDLFVSNAAYSDREKLLDADLDGFRRTIDVSMWGAFYCTRAAARHMAERGGGGAITIVSSPHAVIPVPTAMAYNMAKAAIDHMARTAAIELAEHRIRVNVVHPGWIDTPGERKFFSEDQLSEGAKNLPLGRLGTPEEIGRAICFTLSEDAAYMTGSTLLVDGGVSLPWWSRREEGGQ
jgi:glucose 1-dehydrogenase